MLDKIIIISLIVIAIWSTMLNGMIFGKFGNWSDRVLPKWLNKPLSECVICMTMYYGSAAYWLIWGNSVKEWVIVVIAAMGGTAVFAKTKTR